MTGMYNAVLGDGQEMERATMLGKLLGLRKRDFGRLRDAWTEDHDGVLVAAFYTRNGGGNRPDYEDVTDALRAHPQFLSDADDEFDNTYATYRFVIPAERPQMFVDMGSSQEFWDALRLGMLRSVQYKGPRDMDQVWQDAMKIFEINGPTPELIEKISQHMIVLTPGPDGKMVRKTLQEGLHDLNPKEEE